MTPSALMTNSTSPAPRVSRDGTVTIDGERVGHVERTLEGGHGRSGRVHHVVWVASGVSGQALGRHGSRALAVRTVALIGRQS